MFATIGEIRAANKAAGQFFFSPDTMRFFDSRVESAVYGGRYFITSEQGPHGRRRYTIRHASPNGHIRTVGGFGAWESSASAQRDIARLLKEDN